MNAAAAYLADTPPCAPAPRISPDSIRLPRGVALALCGACPEALSALCRVLWHCRLSGVCFASFPTLRYHGVALSPSVLRRGLLSLLDRGLLASGIVMERNTVSYQPTDALPKTEDSVFIPPEVWRGCKPTELALWVAWRLSHGHLGAEQLGQQVAGRRGPLSRRQSYAVFSTLRHRCLIQCDASAKNCLPTVRKTTRAGCEKRSSNTESSNTDVLKTDERFVLPSSGCFCGRDRGRETVLGHLVSLPAEPPSAQLSFPFGGPLRVVEESPVFIDWLEASGPLTPPGGSQERSAAVKASCGADRKPPDLRSVGPEQPPGHPPGETMLSGTLYQAFRVLCEKAPSIRPPRAFLTPSGLHESEERALAKAWVEAKGAYSLADVVAVADYVNAGNLARRSSPRQWLCQNLGTALQDAEQWRKDGTRTAKDKVPAQYIADAARTDAQSRDGAYIDRQIADGGFGGED